MVREGKKGIKVGENNQVGWGINANKNNTINKKGEAEGSTKVLVRNAG